MSFDKIVKYCSDNKIILSYFFLSTIFFVLRHYVDFAWDFASYVINAKYLIGQGYFMEWLRQPIPTIPLLILSIFGWKLAEYLYIILASTFFLYSSITFAKAAKLDKTIYYVLILNPWVVYTAMIDGAELIGLAFLQLFIAYLISNRIGGHFLGLAVLSRYTVLTLSVLNLFYLRFKNILVNLFWMGLMIVPWLIYSYIKTGNYFTSMANSYALNILYRDYFHTNFNILHVLIVINIVTPFLIAGLGFKIFDASKTLKTARLIHWKAWTKIFSKYKLDIIMVLIFVFLLYNYNAIPLKIPKYLFNLTLPAAYFATVGVDRLLKLKKLPSTNKIIRTAFIILMIMCLVLFGMTKFRGANFFNHIDFHNEAIDFLRDNNLSQCACQSNSWIHMNYLGQPCDVNPRFELVNDSLHKGYNLVLFKIVHEPEYVTNVSFLHQYHVLYESDIVTILGSENGCIPHPMYDMTYLERLNYFTENARNKSIDTNPCDVLLKNKLLNELCYFVNFDAKGKNDQ